MTGENFLNRLPTHERRLENGLTVLVREDHSAPVVAIVTHVKAGYFNEPDKIVGISHVLEHMYFKGTERYGAGEIARATKAVGGYLNAGTIYDHTSYYTVLPSSALEQGLDIQSDALRNSVIDPEELRRELLVIIQEAKRKLDNPSAVATESLYEEMFDVHRIRRWRIGTEEGLRRLTREDVWRYYRDLYHPANIVLVVAGDVDPVRVFELVDRYYGDMPPGEALGERSPEEPERRGFRFREMSGDLTQSYLGWGWRTPGTLHPDTPALDLLATVLGQGRASRLYRGVRERGVVTSISAYNYTPTEIGVFGVSAELVPEDTAEALRAIWREVAALRAEPIGEGELERARNVLEARFLRRMETVEGQANLLAEWQALGDWRLVGRYLDQLFAATPEDLRRVAEEYLALDRATVLVYRPDSSPALGWGVADVAALLEGGGGGEAAGPAGVAGAAAAAEMAEVAESVEAAGPVGGAATVGEAAEEGRRVGRGGVGYPASGLGVEDGVYFYELPNGVRVAIKPRRGSPLVSMGIVVRGGVLREGRGRSGITGLMARVSVKGTRSRSAAALAEATEALGGTISPSVVPDLFQWTLGVPSRHFAAGFALLADAALRPAFREEEVERERRIALSDLEQVRDDMYRYPYRLFLQAAFPEHPYGASLGETEASLRGADRDALERWHRAEVLEGAPRVVVVGDVDPDAASEVIARELAEVRPGPVLAEPSFAAWPEGPREQADRRGKAQTALVLGFPGPRRDEEDDAHAMEVLANILSGLGGRLFEELRSRRSLAYTVTAYPITRWRGGAFAAYIATSPEREEEARRGLLEEFERLAEECVSADELERAQQYTIGAWKIRSQTNGAQLADLADALLLGRGLVELREFEDRIRAVTPVAIRDAVQRYFDPNRLVEGIVRGTGGVG